MAAVIAVGFACFPHLADDLHSAFCFWDTYDKGAPIEWGAYADNLSKILYHNHFRLPNLLMPFVILLPGWIVAASSGTVFAALCLMAARMGGFRAKPLAFALFMLGMTVFYPWLDQLYLTSFQLPYIYGPALALWLLRRLQTHRGNPWLTGMLAFTVGIWHEILGLPVLVTCAVMWLRYRRWRNAATAVSIAALTVGLALLTWLFSFNVARTSLIAFGLRSTSILPFFVPMLVYLGLALALRRRIGPRQFLLVTLTAASLLTCSYFLLAPRITALGNVCALAGMCGLAARHMRRTRAGVAAAALTLGIIAANFAAADAVCLRINRDLADILAKYRRDPSQTVFAHIELSEDAPLWLLFKPTYFGWWAYKYGMWTIDRAYGLPGQPIRYVPEEMATFTPDRAVALGDSIYLYRGHMVGVESTPDWIVADYGMGPRNRKFITVEFRSPVDGKTYLWLHPEQMWVDMRRWHYPVSARRSEAPAGFIYYR